MTIISVFRRIFIFLAFISTIGCDDDGVDNPPRRPEFGPVVENLKTLHAFDVFRPAGVNVVKADIVSKLAGISSLLTTDHGNHDIQCCIEFRLDDIRDLDPSVIRAFGLELTSNHDLKTLVNAPASEVGAFVIVNDITYCRYPREENAIIYGCTIRGKIPSVMHKNAPAEAWAHEFGHLQGLPHYNCAANDEKAPIMHYACGAGIVQNSVSEEECAAFRRLRPFAERGGIVSGEGAICPPQ